MRKQLTSLVCLLLLGLGASAQDWTSNHQQTFFLGTTFHSLPTFSIWEDPDGYPFEANPQMKPAWTLGFEWLGEHQLNDRVGYGFAFAFDAGGYSWTSTIPASYIAIPLLGGYSQNTRFDTAEYRRNMVRLAIRYGGIVSFHPIDNLTLIAGTGASLVLSTDVISAMKEEVTSISSNETDGGAAFFPQLGIFGMLSLRYNISEDYMLTLSAVYTQNLLKGTKTRPIIGEGSWTDSWGNPGTSSEVRGYYHYPLKNDIALLLGLTILIEN